MLPVMGLALILLFSPCKVRNFIQSGLDLAQTQVLNKSKSTFSQSSCQTFEISTTDQTRSKQDPNFSKPLPTESYSVDFSDHARKPSKTTLPSEYQSISDVPLYILYKNLRVFT